MPVFEDEIKKYESIRKEYQQKIVDRMSKRQWMEYNEILFSAHSCAIDGNSFTVDDTRILFEHSLAMIPAGRSLLECTEMADHFRAFDYIVENLEHPFDGALQKEVNRLVTEHTHAYSAPSAEDINLMTSTQKSIDENQHPMIVAAEFHGYYENLHPFSVGNGRTGRLLSNFILLRAGHPLLIVKLEDRSAYISALKKISTEGTNEFLVAFFLQTAIKRMKDELAQKRKNSILTQFF